MVLRAAAKVIGPQGAKNVTILGVWGILPATLKVPFVKETSLIQMELRDAEPGTNSIIQKELNGLYSDRTVPTVSNACTAGSLTGPIRVSDCTRK